MLHFPFVELTFRRLDSCPLDGEAVAVQTGIGQKLDIFFVPVVVVNRVSAGFYEAAGFPFVGKEKLDFPL